jgi:hypothetical protein
MRLIAIYCIVVAIGEVITFGLGLIVERFVPGSLSMLIYMAMFFAVLWGGWPLSVQLTERWTPSADDIASRKTAGG